MADPQQHGAAPHGGGALGCEPSMSLATLRAVEAGRQRRGWPPPTHDYSSAISSSGGPSEKSGCQDLPMTGMARAARTRALVIEVCARAPGNSLRHDRVEQAHDGQLRAGNENLEAGFCEDLAANASDVLDEAFGAVCVEGQASVERRTVFPREDERHALTGGRGGSADSSALPRNQRSCRTTGPGAVPGTRCVEPECTIMVSSSSFSVCRWFWLVKERERPRRSLGIDPDHLGAATEQAIGLLTRERAALGHQLHLAIREANSVRHDIPRSRQMPLKQHLSVSCGFLFLGEALNAPGPRLLVAGERSIDENTSPGHSSAKGLDLVVGERVDGRAAFDLVLPIDELRVQPSGAGAAHVIATVEGEFDGDVQSGA